MPVVYVGRHVETRYRCLLLATAGLAKVLGNAKFSNDGNHTNQPYRPGLARPEGARPTIQVSTGRLGRFSAGDSIPLSAAQRGTLSIQRAARDTQDNNKDTTGFSAMAASGAIHAGRNSRLTTHDARHTDHGALQKRDTLRYSVAPAARGAHRGPLAALF